MAAKIWDMKILRNDGAKAFLQLELFGTGVYITSTVRVNHTSVM